MGVSAKPSVTLLDILRKAELNQPVARPSSGPSSEGFQRLLERVRTSEANTVDRTSSTSQPLRVATQSVREVRGVARVSASSISGPPSQKAFDTSAVSGTDTPHKTEGLPAIDASSGWQRCRHQP